VLCVSSLVHRVMGRLGIEEVNEEDGWNLMWTDSCASLTHMIDMKKYQVIYSSITDDLILLVYYGLITDDLFLVIARNRMQLILGNSHVFCLLQFDLSVRNQVINQSILSHQRTLLNRLREFSNAPSFIKKYYVCQEYGVSQRL